MSPSTRTAPSPQPDIEPWPALAPPRPAPLRAAAARRLLRRVADRAGLRLNLPDGSGFGPADAPALDVLRPDAFFRRVGRDGKIGFGEAYMAGDWDAPDLVAALTPLARNVATLVPAALQAFRGLYDARRPAREDNDRDGARRNVARHYDLSNDLFASFLDETMTYSSALFLPDALRIEALEVAQARKIERLLDVVGARSGTRLLEIGTGWGELAVRAAQRGAHIDTVTLSAEQARFAQARVSGAGLSHLVDVQLRDYRDVRGQYDAIVSVEMIEAVGERWWPTFFRALDGALARGGRVALQAIVMPHDRFRASRRSWTWVHKYIFPGGLIPSAEAIDRLTRTRTRLRVVDALRFGSSYAETLRRWSERFIANEDRVAALGFDHSFRRMWRFYLAYCEAGFATGHLDVAQFTLTRPGDR